MEEGNILYFIVDKIIITDLMLLPLPFRRLLQESEAIHAIHKEDKSLKSGMTVAMTQEFDAKFKMLLEAGAFRSLCMHLAERSDVVQNIDLMAIAGFCRNCFAKVSQYLDD